MQCRQFANIHHLWNDSNNVWSPFRSEHQEEATARTSELRKIESDTLFRSHSQLRSNEHDCCGLCFTRSWLDLLTIFFVFGFEHLAERMRNAQYIYSLASSRFFCCSVPHEQCRFQIHLLILNFVFLLRLLSTTVFSLLKFLTVYFFGFSHQRALFRCS